MSQASAGFLGKVAQKIAQADHHQVCKYETKLDDGFRESLKGLKKLRSELLSRGIRVQEHQNVRSNRAGFPDIHTDSSNITEI